MARNTRHVTAVFTNEEAEFIHNYSNEIGVTRAAFIRLAVAHYLDAEGVTHPVRSKPRSLIRSGVARDCDLVLDRYLAGEPTASIAKSYGCSREVVNAAYQVARKKRGLTTEISAIALYNQQVCSRVISDPFVEMPESTRRIMERVAEVGPKRASFELSLSRQRIDQVVAHAKRLAGVQNISAKGLRYGAPTKRPSVEAVS